MSQHKNFNKQESSNTPPLYSYAHFPLSNIIPVTRARKEFFILSNNVFKKNARYIITDHGVPKVAFFPVGDALSFLHNIETISNKSSNIFKSISNNQEQKKKHYNRNPRFPSFLVADGWRDYTFSSGSELKNIVRAQLTVRLIEQYNFPAKQIIIGYPVSVSSNRFIEADVLVHDEHGHVLSLFIVTSENQFEERKASAIDDLFILAESLRMQDQPSLRLLGYYACEKNKSVDSKNKTILINCQKYPTRFAWESAQFPTIKNIPEYCELLSHE